MGLPSIIAALRKVVRELFSGTDKSGCRKIFTSVSQPPARCLGCDNRSELPSWRMPPANPNVRFLLLENAVRLYIRRYTVTEETVILIVTATSSS